MIEQEIDVLIRARYPIIYAVTWEEERLENILTSIADHHGKRLSIWTYTDGFKGNGKQSGLPNSGRDPIEALDTVLADGEATIYLLKDYHPFITDPAVTRRLRDIAKALKNTRKTLVISSPSLKIPPELHKEIAVVDLPLPTLQDMDNLLSSIEQSLSRSSGVAIDLDPEGREQILKAALGLTLNEAENVFARAIVLDGRLGLSNIEVILSEKQQIIRRSEILEYYPPEESFSSIGGLSSLKDWLKKRSLAFTERAREFGLPWPKGVLLIGVQGCGKSLTAKAVAALWKMPLLRLDVGKVFAGVIGSSEENIRKAINVAESVSPAILWLDELEKGFAGTHSSSFSDAGTMARVFGSFITWLQEKNKPVFVIATANDIRMLPPELMRKGRFDEIFFVDLPDRDERIEILKIHLERRLRAAENYDLTALADSSKGFSGAELEQVVVSGLFDAFEQNRELATEDLMRSINETIPLSRTMGNDIEALREWADGKARMASAGSDRILV